MSPRPPHRSSLSREQFHELTRPLVGMPVAHAWRGHGSALFLELGALTTETRPSRLRGEYSVTTGEVTLMLEWSWRVEGPRSIRFGSWSEDSRTARGIKSLQGHRVLDIHTEGRLPELVVTLEGGLWVHTFMTAEGQPAWALRLPDQGWLAVQRGVLIRQAARKGTAFGFPAA